MILAKDITEILPKELASIVLFLINFDVRFTKFSIRLGNFCLEINLFENY